MDRGRYRKNEIEKDEVINFTGDGPALLYVKKEGSSWTVAACIEKAAPRVYQLFADLILKLVACGG